MLKKDNEIPSVEVPRRVIEHYNRGNAIKSFDEAGYFIFNNVKVYESGKKDLADQKDAMSMEQKLHGGK